MKRYTFLLLTLISFTVLGDPFKNLNFEQANTNSLQFDSRNNSLFGLVTDLLPGWQPFQGTNQLDSVIYNGSSAFLDIGAGPLLIGPGFDARPIDGAFSFTFFSRGALFEPFSLVQRGDIPTDARYLSFDSRGLAPIVTIDSVTVFQPFPTLGYPSTLSIDISQFAGKNVALGFTTEGKLGLGGYGIDDIRFIPDIPEPSTWALFGLGGLLLFCPRARRRLSR